MSSTAPIKVAVIGLGRAGLNIHIRRLQGDTRFQLDAVTDWLDERVAEVVATTGCRGYASHRELLRHTEAEVVVVASASSSHPALSREIMRGGRHVICEKPMAATSRSARSMVEVARQTGRRLFMHHNHRFSPTYRHLQQLMTAGTIGEVFQIRFRDLRFMRRFDWQTLRQFDGGMLNNAGSHYLDLGLQLLGAPVAKVYCNLQQRASAGDVEDHVKVLLTATNGRVYDLELSNCCQVPENRWTLLGTSGTAVCDGSQTRVQFFDPADLPPLQADPGAAADRRYDNDDVIPWREVTLPVTSNDSSDFYDNVWGVLRAGHEMVVTPEQGLAVVRLIETCRRYSGFYDQPEA